jgi:hypothetical protein
VSCRQRVEASNPIGNSSGYIGGPTDRPRCPCTVVPKLMENPKKIGLGRVRTDRYEIDTYSATLEISIADMPHIPSSYFFPMSACNSLFIFLAASSEYIRAVALSRHSTLDSTWPA